MPDLQLERRPGWQRAEGTLQRIGGTLLVLLLLGVCLGLLGRGGPLSTVDIAAAGGQHLAYERVLRYRSPDGLQITATSTGPTVRIALDAGYLDGLQIDRVTPQPAQEITEAQALVLVFRTEPGATLRARVDFQPQIYGRLRGWVAIDGGPRLPLAHLVLP